MATTPNISGESKTIPYFAGNIFRKGTLSIGRRLALCFLLIIVSMIAAGGVISWQFAKMVVPSRRLSNADQASLALTRLRLDLGTFRKQVTALESDHDMEKFSSEAAELRQNFLRNVEDAQRALRRAPEIAREDPTIPAALETLKVTLPSQLDTVVELAAAGDWNAVHLRLAAQIQDLIDLSSSLVVNVSQQAQKQRTQAIEDSATAQKRLFLVVQIAGLLILLLAVALGWYVTQSITTPLAELASGAHALACSDFHHKVNVSGNDELAVVGKAFNHATRQLRELYEELQEQAGLLSLTHDAIYVRDMKGIISYWNRGADALFGWSEEEAVGKVARELLETVSPAPIEQIEAELLRTGRWEGEFSKTKKDRTQVVVASRWSLKRDGRGAPVAILVTSNDITERKRADEAVRESEAKLERAQHIAHVGWWERDLRTNRVFLSDEVRRIFGVEPVDLPDWDKRWLELIHPEDRERTAEAAAAALRGGPRYDLEYRVVRPDGTVRNIHSQGDVMWDDSGQALRQFGVLQDITELREAERELRASESRFRTFVDHAVDAFFLHEDDKLTILDVNREACKSLGYTRDELIGMHPRDFDVGLIDDSLALVAERVGDGEPVTFESIHRRKDGTVFPVEIRVGRFKAGERRFRLSLVRDVSERKRTEEELRESETRFRMFVDHAGDAFFVYDLEDRTIVDVNREACESLGYTRQELIGNGPLAFHQDSYQAEMDSVAKRATAGETVFDTHWHRRKDGTEFPVEIHTSLVSYGGRRFLLMVARDISERLRAEEAIRQSEKQLREVIETIPAIAWTSSSDGSIEFVNKRWQEYTGMSAEEAVGFGWKSAFHPKDLDRYVERRRASPASVASLEDEVRIRCGGTGEYRWFISRAVPLRDQQENIIRWYGTATDIHDRKRAEERLQVENVVLRQEIDKASMFEEVVGVSPALKAVLSAVSKVAATESTVLITGQTGTGKELIARAIHRKSTRSARPFISVNCAAIPQSLIASELFGHEKGAFTGALQRHLGRFELAEGGTIFLDEVGELPMDTQVALLRVLQEREIQRVGGTQPIRVNVRILAATNRDLQKAIVAGTFREDLFYRLNVFPIHIPTLRERKEDIPMLVEYFVDRFARKAGKNIRSIDRQSLELVKSYSWPGNIRELQNVVERSVVICDTDVLSIEESWLSVGKSESPGPAGSMANKIQEQEREFIEKALAETEGKVSGPLGAAAKLGISPSALEYKIRLLKINKHQFKKYLREN